MLVYLLIEAKEYSIEGNVVGVFRTYRDAEIKLKELTTKRQGCLSTNPDDYYIDEHQVLTYEETVMGRIYIACKHCGARFALHGDMYKGYRDELFPKEYLEELDKFYNEHGSRCIKNKTGNCTSNNYDDFIPLREWDTWNPETQSIEYISITN